MGKYAGVLYISKDQAELIHDIMNNKKLFWPNEPQLHFCTELEYFGDNKRDKMSKEDKIIVSTSLIKLSNEKYKFQLLGHICRPKTMSEKLACIHKYSDVYGEHEFVINNRKAVLRVCRR